MFDLGFMEMVVIGVVALVVLGPERLPKAARFVGLWARRARNQWNSVRGELERELAAEDLKKSLDAGRSAMHDLERDLREHGDAAGREAQRLRDEVVDGLPIDVQRRRMEAETGTGDDLPPVAITPSDARDDGPAIPDPPPALAPPDDPVPPDDDGGGEDGTLPTAAPPAQHDGR